MGNSIKIHLRRDVALQLPCTAESVSSAAQFSPAKGAAKQWWSSLQDQRRQKKLRRDLRLVAAFVRTFCDERHATQAKNEFHLDGFSDSLGCSGPMQLCSSCQKLLAHALVKRSHCPLNPKPACRKCSEHCYAPQYREKMREVMRYAGSQLIKPGRLNYLVRLLS